MNVIVIKIIAPNCTQSQIVISSENIIPYLSTSKYDHFKKILLS